MRAHFLAPAVAFLALIPALPATAAGPSAAPAIAATAWASSVIKDEHLRPLKGTLHANAIPNQLPAGAQPPAPGAASRARPAAAREAEALFALAYLRSDSVTTIVRH